MELGNAVQLLPVGRAVEKTRDSDQSTRLQRAATDFEALMVAELLRAARLNGSAGWLGEEDAAADSAFGLAEEHFARSLAGGLGLARLVVDGLDPARPASQAHSVSDGRR